MSCCASAVVREEPICGVTVASHFDATYAFTRLSSLSGKSLYCPVTIQVACGVIDGLTFMGMLIAIVRNLLRTMFSVVEMGIDVFMVRSPVFAKSSVVENGMLVVIVLNNFLASDKVVDIGIVVAIVRAFVATLLNDVAVVKVAAIVLIWNLPLLRVVDIGIVNAIMRFFVLVIVRVVEVGRVVAIVLVFSA